MALSAAEIKILKALQSNPELLAKLQDPDTFKVLQAETIVDRNHRFLLSAFNATERTNFSAEEIQEQDDAIEEFCTLMDSAVEVMTNRFKVKTNEKGEQWRALSYMTADGQTLSLKLSVPFGKTPEVPETEVVEAEKPKPKK